MADIRDRDVPIVDREVARGVPRVKAVTLPNISWGAIFGGLTAGVATHLLLMLFGLAAGLTAVDPQSSEPVGRLPVMVGIWNGVSMLISAFVGGYVAARASGLSRRADGVIHGLVAWGVTTLLFVYLATTAIGSVMGGAFSVLGGVKAAAQTAATAAGQNNQNQDNQNQGAGQNLSSRIQSLITGGGSGGPANVDPQSLQSLQEALRNGDRAQASDILVNQMGLSQERANQIIDQAQPLLSAGPERAREVADEAVSKAAAGSWWLFFGLLLSMVIGLVGGSVGASAAGHRRANRGYAVPA